MTDRYHSLLVVLDRDTRDDDAESLISALSMMKGVAAVTPVVADPASQMAAVRAHADLSEKLWTVLRNNRYAGGA